MTNSRYYILGEVGQGQFGQVFCASDRTTGQLVAMKKLEHRRFPTHRFLRELAVLVRLQHPNIVSFHALEYNATGRYLVMDYCHGGTLRQLMEGKIALTLTQKLQIVRDILLGLEHTHQHSIIHCDLKPENILLNVISQGWSAHIADFGIAQFVEPTAEQSHGSGETGSPAYMAPERFYGKYSPESDLYAVGVLLFELAVGRRPFSGMPIDVMKAHLNQPLRIPKSVPSILKLIIQKALQKLPQHRYESAKAMRMMIETVIANLEYSGPLSGTSPNHLAEPSERLLAQAAAALPAPEPLEPDDLDNDPPDNMAAALHRPYPKIMHLVPAQLHLCTSIETAIHQLWFRPQGCFIATMDSEAVSLSVFNPQIGLQPIGKLPQSVPCSAEKLLCLDLDPKGRWLAVLQTRRTEPSLSQSSDTADTTSSAKHSGLLQVFKLSNLQQACHQTLHHTANQLWFASPEHILVACSATLNSPESQNIGQTLELWNRRGQFYWSNPFPTQLRPATLSGSQRFFALTDEQKPMGLWLDLCPFKIKQTPVGIQSDWVCPMRWGYILVNQGGTVVCLNRRGRVMAQADLPIPSGAKISAIATSEPNLLWLAIQQPDQSMLYTLDLTPNLPKSLLKL